MLNLARLPLGRDCFWSIFGVVYIISHGPGNLFAPVLSVGERPPADLNRREKKKMKTAPAASI